MKRFFLALLACSGACAQAAPISGKVALGTWGTQAEFADFRVVRAASRFEPGNSRTDGFTFVGGNWSISRGVLRQTGGGYPALAMIGEPSWRDYTITVRARKTGGAEGFLIGFGMQDPTTKNWLSIGGWGNTLNALEVPGVALPAVPGYVMTGRWYSIKVEIQGSDIRCYLDGVKLFDTMRLLDWSEMSARRGQVLSSRGLSILPGWEQDQVRNLLSRSIYLGRAARETYNAMPSSATFSSLTTAQQVPIVRKINRYRLTWNQGWGFGIDAWRDATIIQAVDDAVALYNSKGVFDKEVVANNSPGTPTADANWDGQMRFGGSLGYRVTLHEISHTLGVGTYGTWGSLMFEGFWHGTYANLKLQQITGDSGAILRGDGIHFWPYGLNYESELGQGDDVRHVQMVAGLRRDMGLNGVLDTMYLTDVPATTYRLTPRLATGSAIEATTGDAGALIDIRAYSGSANQKFRLEKQSDGAFIIRSALPSGRCIDLLNGDASNGQTIRLWDDNSGAAQRWYFVPMGDGWFKIAPKNGIWKAMDLWGVSPDDGTPVKLYDFWDGFGQQFRLDPVS